MSTSMSSSERHDADAVLAVFTADQVMRLTGLTKRRLEYWLDRGILSADVDRGAGRGRVRLFTFRNLVEARVAVWLRDKLSLQLIRKIVAALRDDLGVERPLADVTFGVVEDRRGRGRPQHRVVVLPPDRTGWQDWRTGQLVIEVTVPLERFADELRAAATRDRARRRQVGRVERRRGVLGSTPVVAGTRVPTRAIRALHEAGYTVDRILESYPGLRRDDVRAALRAEARRTSA